jgi:O-antigen/teichoic acid export membrane protein
MFKTIKFGILPMLNFLMITLNYTIDTVILKLFVDYRHIGYYSVGIGLVGSAWVIPDAFKEVLFGKTAKSDSIEDILLSIKITFYFSLAMILLVILLGKYVIVFLYGKEFLPAYIVTNVIFVGTLSMIFYKLIYTLFIAQGKSKVSFIILLISVLLNVVLNFSLDRLLGIIGAALASVGSYSLCGFLFLYVFILDHKISLKNVFLFNDSEKIRIKRFFANLKQEMVGKKQNEPKYVSR